MGFHRILNPITSEMLTLKFWDAVGLRLYSMEKNKKSSLKLHPIFWMVLQFVTLQSEKQATEHHRAEREQTAGYRKSRGSRDSKTPTQSLTRLEAPPWPQEGRRESAQPAAPDPVPPPPLKEGNQTHPGQTSLQPTSPKPPTPTNSPWLPLKSNLRHTKSVNFGSTIEKSQSGSMLCEDNNTHGWRHVSELLRSALHRRVPSSLGSQDSLSNSSLSSCPSDVGHPPFVGQAWSVSLPLIPVPTPGQRASILPSGEPAVTPQK